MYRQFCQPLRANYETEEEYRKPWMPTMKNAHAAKITTVSDIMNAYMAFCNPLTPYRYAKDL